MPLLYKKVRAFFEKQRRKIMQKEDFNRLIQSAREADLLSYFQKSGYHVDRHGENYYVKEIRGLCIKPDRNQWYNHYTNTGRTNN